MPHWGTYWDLDRANHLFLRWSVGVYSEMLTIFLQIAQQPMQYNAYTKNIQRQLSFSSIITACYKSRQGCHSSWIKVNLFITIKFKHMRHQRSILQLFTPIICSNISWAGSSKTFHIIEVGKQERTHSHYLWFSCCITLVFFAIQE